MRELPCIICGKELEPAIPGNVINQPYEGTIFTSRGQYGSTVYDPGSHDLWLQITICDICMIIAARRHAILERERMPVPEPEPDARFWKPPKPEYDGTHEPDRV